MDGGGESEDEDEEEGEDVSKQRKPKLSVGWACEEQTFKLQV